MLIIQAYGKYKVIDIASSMNSLTVWCFFCLNKILNQWYQRINSLFVSHIRLIVTQRLSKSSLLTLVFISFLNQFSNFIKHLSTSILERIIANLHP